MTALAVLIIFYVSLTLVFFVSKRRFGLPALGLIAGALLTSLWAPALARQLESFGVTTELVPLTNVVMAALTIIPGLLLMSVAGKTHTHLRRLVGSLAFGLLALILTLDAVVGIIVLDDAAMWLHSFLSEYQPVILGAGVVAAMADLLIEREAHPGKKRGKH